jgi:hypothetical protein
MSHSIAKFYLIVNRNCYAKSFINIIRFYEEFIVNQFRSESGSSISVDYKNRLNRVRLITVLSELAYENSKCDSASVVISSSNLNENISRLRADFCGFRVNNWR